MKCRTVAVAGVALLCSTLVLAASSSANAIKPAPADPAIVAALKQVSAQQIRADIEKLVTFGNRSTLSSDQPAASGHGINAARDWIKAQFEEYSRACGGCLEVKLDTFTQPPSDRVKTPTEISNVYAVLKGADSEQGKRIVLVTGHYDSRNSDNFNTTDPAPGANDDASGTAVSLECARVLSKLKFPATIIFLTVAGEEQGLYGSAHFAKMAKDNGWQLEAVLNNDIVGGNRTPGETQQNPRTVRVFSEAIPANATEADLRRIRYIGGENDSPSRELARYVAETAHTYMPASFQPTLIYRTDRYLRGGDHESFNEQGFAAVRFTEWREDFNHQHQNVRVENGIQYGDLPQFVDFDYVASVARLNAATLAEIASAPMPPTNVKIVTKQLENSTTLTWDFPHCCPAADEPARARFRVLWRHTDAPDWQDASGILDIEASEVSFTFDPRHPVDFMWQPGRVGGTDAYSMTVPISKDNVIFAVRAVNWKGHRSLPVIPIPER